MTGFPTCWESGVSCTGNGPPISGGAPAGVSNGCVAESRHARRSTGGGSGREHAQGAVRLEVGLSGFSSKKYLANEEHFDPPPPLLPPLRALESPVGRLSIDNPSGPTMERKRAGNILPVSSHFPSGRRAPYSRPSPKPRSRRNPTTLGNVPGRDHEPPRDLP